ncbi:hypothetical protein ACROYT_G016066 [Oculina patagonica]
MRADRLNNRFGQELKSSLPQHEKERRHGNKDKQDLPFKATTLATQRKGNRKSANTGSATLKCYQCSGPHTIWQCETFKNASYEDRSQTVHQKKLCGSCLSYGHFSRSCPKGFSFRKSGCGKRHHFLLHRPDREETDDRVVEQESANQQPVIRSQSSVGGTAATLAESNPPPVIGSSTFAVSRVEASTSSRPRVCFKVVPVRVSGPGGHKQLTTYAFLDSGSDTTLCLESLVEELSLECEPTDFTLLTVNYEGKERGHPARLDIEALDGRTKFTLDQVLTMESLPIGERHFASNRELTKWPHLDGISLPEIQGHRVSILIGSDQPDIIDDNSEIRRGARGQPYAVNTLLGWTVYGPMGEPNSDGIHVNFVRSDHEEMLSVQLERCSLSFEDQRAKQIMDESAVLVDGHYQLKLPFRHSPPCLPDSLPVAKKRLHWLKKRMEKDPAFHKQYASVIQKYQEEGSSRQVPDEEVSTLKPIWYLPHHAVWHPRKPEEPRVVFDCACKSKGVSLNNQLLQGPENTSSLIGVILRFRVNSVAVAADIKQMFHQVFVSPEDRGALCYLWLPDGDLTRSLEFGVFFYFVLSLLFYLIIWSCPLNMGYSWPGVFLLGASGRTGRRKIGQSSMAAFIPFMTDVLLDQCHVQYSLGVEFEGEKLLKNLKEKKAPYSSITFCLNKHHTKAASSTHTSFLKTHPNKTPSSSITCLKTHTTKAASSSITCLEMHPTKAASSSITCLKTHPTKVTSSSITCCKTHPTKAASSSITCLETHPTKAVSSSITCLETHPTKVASVAFVVSLGQRSTLGACS